MIYFGNPTTQEVRDAMVAGLLGAITTPDQRNAIPDGVPWVADNGLGPGRGDPSKAGKGARSDDAWFEWLASRPWPRETCVFAVAPDVVGDPVATLERSRPWLPKIRGLGLPAAFVAQDGLELLLDAVPWDDLDVLFVGGSTEWKLGPGAVAVIDAARARGKRIHFGRVNSLKRLRYAIAVAGDDVTVDGTFLAFGPSTNLPRLRRWIDTVRDDPFLPLPVEV